LRRVPSRGGGGGGAPAGLPRPAKSHQGAPLRACEVLGAPVPEDWRVPQHDAPLVPADGLPRAAWLAARRKDARWAREYLVPWVNRRLHGTSSGDGLTAKRPELRPLTPSPGR